MKLYKIVAFGFLLWLIFSASILLFSYLTNADKELNNKISQCIQEEDELYSKYPFVEKVRTIEDMDFIIRGNRKIEKEDIEC